MTQIPFYQELFILFWRFVQGNVYFLDEVVSHPEFLPKIYAPVLFYFDSQKKDPTKCNFLYICVFVLLTLSSNRDFSMALNDPYTLQLQFDLKDFEGGSYADLTYLVIHRMIKVGPGILRPLYKSLVSVLSNTAPYVKSLSKDSSESIFSLIKMFSSVELLRKREETSRILSNLFEAVNYILLYHDEGNEEFLVSLIKYREVMKVADLKLADPPRPDQDSRPHAADAAKAEPEAKPEPESEPQLEPKLGADEHEAPAEEPPAASTEPTVAPSQDESKSEEPSVEPNAELNAESNAEPSAESAPATDSSQPESKPETQSKAAPVEEEKSEQPAAQPQQKPTEEPRESESVEETKEEAMVDVPLDDIKHQQNDESEQVVPGAHIFLSPEWEKEWKQSLNLANLKQAIQYTDDKARAFLAKNPSPDNNIDADKFVEFLRKSSLKGLLPNQVKILVTTYNGNNSIDTWAISYIWGQIFMRQQEVPLFNIESIKMFKVNYIS